MIGGKQMHVVSLQFADSTATGRRGYGRKAADGPQLRPARGSAFARASARLAAVDNSGPVKHAFLRNEPDLLNGICECIYRDERWL